MKQSGLTLEALEQAQQELLQQLSLKDLLLHAIEQLTSSFDLSATLPAVVDTICEAINTATASIVLVDNNGIVSYSRNDISILDLGTYDKSIVDLARNTQTPLTLPTTSHQMLEALSPMVTTVALWPLFARQKNMIGVLWVTTTDDTISPLARQFLDALSVHIARAVSRATIYKHARDDRKWLAAILGSTADPVLAVDDSGRITLLNHASEDLLGVQNQAAIDQPVTKILAGYPQLLKLFQHASELEDDAEWESPDGRVYSPRLAPVESESGTSNGSALTLRDVTPFKLLNRNQSEFVRLVSHDLRSPLTFMQGFADLVGMVGDLNNQQAEFMEKILSGIHQITTLVDNIQDAGRWDPQTGFYEMAREPVDLTRTLSDIVSNHQNLAEKSGIHLIENIAPGIPIVNVDTLMIERALINLVMNAIKYSPNGGEVQATMEVEDNAIVICISDSGLGIAPEHIPNLFKRGTRIVTEETKKNRIKGSGLGLFIVQSVARRHGGDVWVTSQVGRGSRFYFSIPLEGANLIGSA